MKNIAKFLILISSIFIIYFTIAAQSAKICEPQSCDSRGPVVRFPFQLKDRQPAGCGQPGFDLYCDIRGRTIINLPESGEFVVRDINYRTQSLHIDDPRSCLPSRSLNFSLTGSPFRGLLMSRFVYFNCSDRWTDYDSSVYFVPLDCLSRENDTVVAVNPASPGADQVPPPCRRMTEVSIPLQWSVSRVTFWLGWTEPECQRCENQGGVCGYKDDSGQEIGCSRHAAAGLARSAKYAIIIGVGIPGLICIVGLACYSLGMIKHGSFQRHLNGSHLSATSTTQLPITRAVAAGLDGPTIESYPKTILGESRRFPKSSDGTCSICLSEYQPKEILRSIPECNHCFHADCIDEWLKLNGTCPVCRSSPDSSSLATTPCSSNVSSPSSSDSATLDHHH